ncbi:MAG: glycoside hydrolase family 3 C-terminal domain-containing protein [Oscillospiraceae bacterium]|nr:glycoside hydrolase family 3 C-terminal domain-containing protein [Oscillospiraceae bacterium]
MALKHADLIAQMTLEEKASMCDGLDFWHSQPIDRLGIKSVALNDGPHGIRKKGNPDEVPKGEKNILKGVPAICFPTASATACSWDVDLIRTMGEALGDECRKEKVSVLLGPGTNIKRSPLCGRNFEYFSEDPELSGEMSAAFINGVQSKGIGTSLKHYAANNQETRRMTVNTVVDERTLREIYLRPFEIAVKKAQPWTIMCAYERLNGYYCAENKWLLTDVLRDDFGYENLVVTDWGAENQRVDGLKAGNELEMPTSSGDGTKLIIDAVNNGELDVAVLDHAVDLLLDMVDKSVATLGDYTYDPDEHHALARKIAGQCMVLMKNDGGILPLKKSQKVAVIGEMAKNPRYQGAGSSLINPIKLDNACDTLTEMGINYDYAAGYSTAKKNKISDDTFVAEAVTKAKDAEVALLFIGLTDEFETEGNDRKHLGIPPLHNRLVEEVLKVNPNVVVVLSGGSSIEMPWADKVPAILNGFLTGQAGGSAVCDILFGDVNPSGKLAETYPVALEDNSSANYFPGTQVSVEYREGIYVGYRYYDSANIPVRFPFGHGLSYTTFEYSDLKVSADSIKDTDTLTVTFKVKNTGSVDGAEIVQLYVSDVESTIYRPVKELKGFKKVFLKAGEEKEVSIDLEKRAFAFYNVDAKQWQVESGEFKILVGASSRDIKLEASVNVESTDTYAIPDYKASAPAYYGANIMNVSDDEFKAVLGHEIPASTREKGQPLTILNTLEDAYDTKWGGRFCRLLTKFLGTETMAGAIALQTPIKNFISMSFGIFSPEMAEGLLMMLNEGKFWKPMGKMIGSFLFGGGIKKLGRLKQI